MECQIILRRDGCEHLLHCFLQVLQSGMLKLHERHARAPDRLPPGSGRSSAGGIYIQDVGEEPADAQQDNRYDLFVQPNKQHLHCFLLSKLGLETIFRRKLHGA